MDPEFLIRGVLGSVMGGRGRKRSRKAMRYLTGRQGSFLTHPTTLLTGLGLAWGVYETMQAQGTAGSGPAAGSANWGPGPGAGAAGTPPAASAAVPPLPAVGPSGEPVDAEALRLVRLAISAANADGAMNDHERAAVVQQAQAAGVGAIVEQELRQPRPLAEIVAGIGDAGQRGTLYVLAYTVLRADEQLNGAERIYLAQLAHLLGLDRATVERLEKDTGERLDALGDQGQLGG